jgi:hypothetical protein
MRRRGRRVRSRWWPRSPLPAVDCARSRRRTARRPSASGLLRSRPDRDFCARSRRRSTWPRRPGVPAVSEDTLDERKDTPRGSQQRAAAVAILDARRMGFEHEAAAVGIDQRVALAPVDLLAGIVTARAAGLGGLDALAVDDRGRGAAVAPTRSRSAITSAWFTVQSARRRARRRTSGKWSPMACTADSCTDRTRQRPRQTLLSEIRGPAEGQPVRRGRQVHGRGHHHAVLGRLRKVSRP